MRSMELRQINSSAWLVKGNTASAIITRVGSRSGEAYRATVNNLWTADMSTLEAAANWAREQLEGF